MLEKNDKIGEYILVRFLGKGQFGEVWLAEKQIQFSQRRVRHALKFLSNLGDDVNMKAAEDEVDTWIEAGGHPNVMSVIDMLIANNHIVIISEFAEGGSLNSWLKKNGGKAPTQEQALDMMLGILRGIEHLHSRNVVHRDLKPDNILLQGNFPRITDFGISRIVSTGTMSTKPIGSPAYMSPESFIGNKSPQTDIWSAGVILYEMLTGRFPYEHEMVWGLINSIQTEEPKPVPGGVPAELRSVIENALQKNTDNRFHTATEMRLALERAIYSLRLEEDRKTVSQEFPEPGSQTDDAWINKLATLRVEAQTEKMDDLSTNIPPEPAPEKTQPQTNKSAATLPSQKTPSPTQPAQVQPAQTQISPVVSTDDKYIQDTQDWREIEQRRQAEIRHISQAYSESGGEKKQNKTVLFAALGGGGFALLALIGVFAWAFSGGGNSGAGNGIVNTVVNKTSANSSPPVVSSSASKTDAPKGMVYIPGGEFTMGRDDGKSEAETPAHKVNVNPFYIDIYEMTVEKFDNPDNESKGLPKVGVNWEQASNACKKVGKRLPTEAEWEFAARGTESFIYPWGNEWKQGNANVGTQSFNPVGKNRGTSPFGLFDMSGNAWEWTASDFTAYPNGKLPDAFVGKTNLKTIRGGSFEATKDFATTTYRIGWAVTGAINYDRTGFRCVQDIGK